MKQILIRTLLGLLVIAALSYPADWIVWKVRSSHGNGMGKVQVISVVAAQMKNNKEEYYLGDVNTVDCSYFAVSAGRQWSLLVAAAASTGG